jgi:SAM-dependent methyltransferase
MEARDTQHRGLERAATVSRAAADLSTFTAEWLRLRESADALARSPRITARVGDWARRKCAAQNCALRIVDLGCGTGSNFRYLAPRLPIGQRWLLVDQDPTLLREAERRAAGRLALGGSSILGVDTRQADLATADLAEIVGDADLVAASAFFDLVSAAWAERLLAVARRAGNAMLVVLSYDGRLDFSPPDPFDRNVRHLFNRHQRSDKGFGPALGDQASVWLARAAAASGGYVYQDPSDWSLGQPQLALQEALVVDFAAAAAETDPDASPSIAAWRQRRMDAAQQGSARIVVGHQDLFLTW